MIKLRRTTGRLLVWTVSFLTGLGLIFYGFAIPPRVTAQTPSRVKTQTSSPQECGTAQVLLVIDYSASMYQRTDLNGLRIWASLNIADILANKYLSAPLDPQSGRIGKRFELAAVLFASGAPEKYWLDWISIAPADRDTWEQSLREQIKNQFDLTPQKLSDFVNRDEGGNGTNFVEAFESANQLWATARQPDNGCTDKLMLLLTDGGPSGAEPLRGVELEAHMQQVSVKLQPFLDAGGQFYVTAIDDSDQKYWPYMKDYWQQFTHSNVGDKIVRAELVTSQDQIGLRMAEIVNEVIRGGDFQVPVGNLSVPPYLQSMSLTYYKPDLTDVLLLVDPMGAVVQPNGTTVISQGDDTAIQRLEISQPQPGIYKLATSLSRSKVIITMQMTFARAKLIAPVAPLQQFTTGSIAFQLMDNLGNPLLSYNDPRYSLQVTALAIGDGITSPVSLVPGPSNSYVGNFTPVKPGIYNVLVAVTAQDDESRTWSILEPDAVKAAEPLTPGSMVQSIAIGDFSAQPLKVQVGQAQSQQPGCGLNQFLDFYVPLALYNAATNQLAVPSVPVKWNITAQDVAGTPITTKVEGPDANGQYSLTVSPQTDKSAQIALIASAPDPQTGLQYEFDRYDTTYDIAPGLRAKFEILHLAQEADGLTRQIENYLHPGSEDLVIGRSMFYLQRDVQVSAHLLNLDTQTPATNASFLPRLELVKLDTPGVGRIILAKPWALSNAQNDEFLTTIPSPGLGLYSVRFTPNSVPCGVTITNQSRDNLRLGAEWVEYLLLLVATILLFVIFIAIAKWIICRLAPLKGYLVVGNTEGYYWYTSLGTRQCYDFRMDSPEKCCRITRIEVDSLFGNVRVHITQIVSGMGDKERRDYGSFRREDRFKIPITPQCTVRWIRDEDRGQIGKYLN